MFDPLCIDRGFGADDMAAGPARAGEVGDHAWSAFAPDRGQRLLLWIGRHRYLLERLHHDVLELFGPWSEHDNLVMEGLREIVRRPSAMGPQ